MNKNYLKLFITALIFLPMLLIGMNNLFSIAEGVQFLLICGAIVSILFTACATFDPKSVGIEIDSQPAPYLKIVRGFIIIAACVWILPWIPAKRFYNNSVDISYRYEQKCQERPLFYDMMWKTYDKKKEIQGLSIETFKQIASIVMEARKDGPAVAWKWTQENTNIPFQEFTKFYGDLSSFIEGQRREYYNIETQCQQLAQQNNFLIDRFPNNLYNTFIGRKHIYYSPGFLSTHTTEVFSTKNE